MKCQACGHDNPVGHKFCGECGSGLELPCAACGAANPPANKFCGACGQPLISGTAPTLPRLVPVVAPVTSIAPTSFAGGRYEVKRFLGEGGKKRVYLAHDMVLDRDVAFALIRSDGLDEIGRVRVRREAQAMGRLGAHPHIVSVFDLGDHEGQPFMVTELMGGGDVEGLTERAPEQRVPLAQAIRIADEVCWGLEFAHEQQIVHRDLKPGNVWLTSDGTAKIGDFGLAVATDRSRLTQAGLMVGTVSYMPPEQALGGEVTPRSDLYSLGAMLYELVTGRPPFIGDESVAIITQHLNVAPVAPGWHNPLVPPSLEALILRLLEKDPNRRPTSATEVRAALAAVALSRPSLHTSQEADSLSPAAGGQQVAGSSYERAGEWAGEAGGPRAENPLYRQVFVGRETELRQAKTAFDRALSGQGSVLMVAGEPGIGKTALCEQLATYVAMRGGRALAGHSYEEGSLSLPYLPFIEALRSYVLARDPAGLRRDLGGGAASVARIVSDVRTRLELAPGAGADSDGGSVDPDEERWRLLHAVTEFVRNASREQALLIVLEDLHWADRGSFDLLTHLARNLQGARLLVVGTYRDVDVDRQHPLSAALGELRRGPGFDRILLRGLTAPETQRMLSAIANQEAGWGFAEAVHRQTEGNPLFVQEVARYLAEEGFVVRENGRWRATSATPLELHIPEGLREVIGKRLARLSPECNRVLTLAAVIGREFALETLQAVAALDEEMLVTALEEAIRVGVLQEEVKVGGAHYRFAHAFFRQTLYEEMSVPRRLRLHQQVARVLEEQYDERIEDHAGELAEHFAHSSTPTDLAKAVAYGEIAAQRAISVNAYGEAVRHLEQALEIQGVLDPDAREQRCDLLLAIGQALLPAGDPRRAYQDVAPEALALAEAIGNRGRAARACRVALEGLSRHGGIALRGGPAFRQWAEKATRYADPGSRLLVYADAAMSMVMLRDGRRVEARRLAEGAYQLARDLGDVECIFWSGFRLAAQAQSAEHRVADLDLLDDLVSASHEGVSARTLELLLRTAQSGFLAAGERGRAERCWTELDELASRTQDASLLTWPATREAVCAALDGDLATALTRVEQADALLDELGGPGGRLTRLRAQLLFALGRADEVLIDVDSPLALVAAVGRQEEAATRLRVAVDQLDRTGEEDESTSVLVDLLETAVLLGDRELAPGLAERLGDVVGTCPTTYALYNVARLRGAAADLVSDRDAARRAYREALEWAERIQYRPEIALTRLGMAELLLSGDADDQANALEHLGFAIDELSAMKMRPALERALSHKGVLKA